MKTYNKETLKELQIIEKLDDIDKGLKIIEKSFCKHEEGPFAGYFEGYTKDFEKYDSLKKKKRLYEIELAATKGLLRHLISRLGDFIEKKPQWNTINDLREKDNTGLHNELLEYLLNPPVDNNTYYKVWRKKWGKKKMTEVLQTLEDKLKTLNMRKTDK